MNTCWVLISLEKLYLSTVFDPAMAAALDASIYLGQTKLYGTKKARRGTWYKQFRALSLSSEEGTRE